MADRLERLTNLLALLLETAEPLSLVSIADELDGQYPDNHRSRRAAFERDKATLRDIGVIIEQEIVSGTEHAGQTRYWIDRDRFELADLDLDPDETRALQVALAATRPGSRVGQDALWKVGAGLAEDRSPVVAPLPDSPALPVVRDAIASAAAVSFRYRDLDRTVDPWALLLRDGFWYLIGHDHVRSERRTYRLDRIDGPVSVVDGSRADRPADFDPRDVFPDDPKLIGADPGRPDAVVRIDAGHARRAEAELGEDKVVARRGDGGIDVVVPCGNDAAFRSWLIGYLDAAEVVSPAEVRDGFVAWLEQVAR